MTAIFRRLFPFAAALLTVCMVPQPSHALWGSKNKAAEKAGAILFRDKGCVHCHGEGGVGGKKAPSLVGIRKNKLWTPAKMSDQILNGGKKMPPFADSLTDAQISQLVAYLRARHRPVPPPEANPAMSQ